MLDLLAQPDNSRLAGTLNSYLERLNERAGTLAIYILDRRGKVLASSNWRRGDSFA